MTTKVNERSVFINCFIQWPDTIYGATGFWVKSGRIGCILACPQTGM